MLHMVATHPCAEYSPHRDCIDNRVGSDRVSTTQHRFVPGGFQRGEKGVRYRRMKAETSIAEALGERILVFDGAMGTEIYRNNIFTNRCFDELSISASALIRGIHESYAAAGADVMTTNSFGGNRHALSRFGLGESVREINIASAKLARDVADAVPGRPVFVAGSVGPVLPDRPDEDVRPAIAEQVAALSAGGVDFILFETLPTRRCIDDSSAAMKLAGVDVPYVLSFTVHADGESAAGETVDRLMAPLPPDVPCPAAWGLNCGVGPDAMLTAVERAVHLTDLPVIAQPNAGMPREVENRQIYFCSPEYLTTYARRYVELGARAVGGCCGTAPEHIREIVRALKPLTRKRVAVAAAPAASGAELRAPTPLAERSRFANRLARGQWVSTVELLPPRGTRLDAVIAKAQHCHRHGVDAVNIPDGPRASSRLSPLVTAVEIQRRAHIEAILHFCCRDRNLIGMQADLLACAACGVRNILFVTGDPPKVGKYPTATGVFDADSIGMAAVQKRLNQGVDIGGQAVEPATAAVIGVGADPNALDLDREVRRFQEKVEAGAEFAITQPVFDAGPLFRFLDRVRDLGIPVIAGIWPLASLRNASFMRNEVPGVVVPDEIMERMAAETSREGQRATGIRIAGEMVERVRDRVAGIQVSAPFGNVDTALAVIEG